jgi:hypothetical protein
MDVRNKPLDRCPVNPAIRSSRALRPNLAGSSASTKLT